ncbi:nucleotidyltransferase domain-containing protein [Candidatus Woesearchaeota archaeon]|nr:nucleotidyltransferase domain-containing protein [Candidatus Woesearchaeota archaeon]
MYKKIVVEIVKYINDNIFITIVHKMATLLKNGIMKIIQVFYRRKKEKIHLRKLARETKMHGQSIIRYLDCLEKEQILNSKKEGNLKQYELMDNRRTYAVISLLDLEKMEKLPLLRRNAINIYIKTLPQLPTFVIIFGSTAKETYTAQSDIDILIVTNTKIDTTLAEKEADAQCGMNISTFQINYKKFIKELRLKEEPVIQSAIQTGYPVLNHIFYYEVLYNERV